MLKTCIYLLATRRKRLSSALFANNHTEEAGNSHNRHDDVSIYTFFVEKSLKLRGMRKVLLRLLKILVPCLNKVKLTLQTKPTNFNLGRMSKVYQNLSIIPPKCKSFPIVQLKDESFFLQKFGHHHPAFKLMHLPDYFGSFLFLLKIPFNLTHEWLRIRISQKQITNPDPITLDQVWKTRKFSWILIKMF